MKPASPTRPSPSALPWIGGLVLLGVLSLASGRFCPCAAADRPRGMVLDAPPGSAASDRIRPLFVPDLVRPEPSSAGSASLLPVKGGDDLWWDGFALPDLDGWVNAAIVYDGSIVIAGRFTLIGGRSIANIARWDGADWIALGEGFDGDVLSLALLGGDLVASGRFGKSGASMLHGIARWDGDHWNPLGEGLAPVGATALAVSGNDLYAAGGFDRAGTVMASFVARWDGSAWSPLGTGLDGPGQSLYVQNDSVYVGGSFLAAGGAPASSVALWDGSIWSALGSGISGAYGYPYVFGLTKYRDLIVAVGYFDSAGSAPATNLAGWDGSTWHVFGDSLANGVYAGASVLSKDDTLFVGGYGLSIWDGSAWSYLPPSANGWVSCILETPLGLGVGGSFIGYSYGGDIAAVNIGIIRDGAWSDLATWSSRTHGLGGAGIAQVTALTTYRGKLVAGGRFEYAGGSSGRVRVGPFAQWDGANWSALDPYFYGLPSCLLAEGDQLYAGGVFWSYPSTAPVVRFDGTTWTALDTLSFQATRLARYQGDLYICGYRGLPRDPDVGGVIRWKDAHWETVGSLDTLEQYVSVSDMIEYQGRLIASGSFHSIGGVTAKGLAAWDGQAWSAMDQGLLAAQPRILGACDGVLYASGDFYVADEGQAGIVQWDGERWRAVEGAPRNLYVLGCANHALLAGGYVDDSNHILRGIARWDGRTWSTLGSGVDGYVDAMEVLDGQLYVGGRFSRAGGRSSSAIARWDLRTETRVATLLRSEGGVPNPFTATTSIAFQLSAPGRTRVTVFDVRGRRVAILDDASHPAGTHAVTWNGLDDQGRTAPAGIYFVRMELPGRSETRRVVRLQ